MDRLIKMILVIFMLLIQVVPAQWHKLLNFPYNPQPEYLISIIEYKNKIFVGDLTHGIFYSDNYCDSFKELNLGLAKNYTTYWINNIYCDSSGLYVMNFNGLYKLNEELNKWQIFANTTGILSLAKIGEVYIGGLSGNGVYISTDNGISWNLNYLTAGMIWDAKSIVVLNNKFFVSGTNGVYSTLDNGINWQNVLSVHTSQLLLSNDTLFAGTIEGVKFTVNEGMSWIDVGPNCPYIKCIEKFNNKYFAGGDLSIKYFSPELMDWIPATRNSPDGFTNQVQFLKIIDDTLYSCNYGGLFRRALNDFNYPELSLPDSVAGEYYNEQVGEISYVSFAIGNFGFDTLKVFDIQTSNPDFEISRRQMDIPPEWGYGVNLTYKITDPGIHSATITVITNDTIPKNSLIVLIKGLPIDFELKQNYPNPFNPDTKIIYSLPSTQQTSLKVYNSIGELVEVLVDDIQGGGRYTVDLNAFNLAAGVYFYQLISGSNVQTKKMILLK
ncbi:MAG: T9SS type A sorting domain-containing protein [bacterium]|nr:T9SS type A sorting domain-containing protein [bacterium]